MGTSSQSRRAAVDTASAVDRAAVDALAPKLKQSYLALRASYQPARGDPVLIPPSDDIAFDSYIESLAREVAEGTTARAKQLRQIIEEHASREDKEQLKQLDQIVAIRESAAKAVHDNTGDFEFLGGSTVWNAIAGFFKWVFSGFNAGFEGLKQVIADRAVANTVADFQGNLLHRGIDPHTSFGKSVVSKFISQANRRVGLNSRPDLSAPNLRSVPIDGFDPKSVADDAKPVTVDPENKEKAIKEHFGKVADSVIGLAGTYAKTLEDKALLAKAKESLAARGAALAKDYAGRGESLPADFNLQLIKETFSDMRKQLDPVKDVAAIKVVDKVLDTMKDSKSVDEAVTALQSTSHEQVKRLGSLIRMLHSNLRAGHGNLLVTLSQVYDNNPALATQAGQSKEADKQESRAVQVERRKAILTEVNIRLNEMLDPESVLTAIDKAIDKVITEDYPTDPSKHSNATVFGRQIPGSRFIKAGLNLGVGDRTARAVGLAPSAKDRKKLALFMSRELKEIVAKEVEKRIEEGNTSINMDEVIEVVHAEFERRFENATASDGPLKSWATYKDLISRTTERELRTSLKQAGPALDEALKVAFLDDVRRLPGMEWDSLAAASLFGDHSFGNRAAPHHAKKSQAHGSGSALGC